MSDEQNPFKPGDVVTLKSDGHVMVVSQITTSYGNRPHVALLYFDSDGDPAEFVLPTCILRHHTEQFPTPVGLKFSPGDCVVLKSGGRAMVVSKVQADAEDPQVDLIGRDNAGNMWSTSVSSCALKPYTGPTSQDRYANVMEAALRNRR